MYNVMLRIFKTTGSIEAFLYLRNHKELTKDKN